MAAGFCGFVRHRCTNASTYGKALAMAKAKESIKVWALC